MKDWQKRGLGFIVSACFTIYFCHYKYFGSRVREEHKCRRHKTLVEKEFEFSLSPVGTKENQQEITAIAKNKIIANIGQR